LGVSKLPSCGVTPQMPLTDTGIRNTKPADKPLKLADGGGLFLLVMPSRRHVRWAGCSLFPPLAKIGRRRTPT